ncbi:MAG: sensor histidine kinase [Desulfuromonadaceae bacterium]
MTLNGITDSFRKRIILGFTLLIILFLGVMITVEITGIPFTDNKGTFAAQRSKTLSDMELASGILGERLSSWFTERRVDVDGLSTSPLLRKSIESRSAGSGKELADELASFLASHPDVAAVVLFDPFTTAVRASSGGFGDARSAADIGIAPDKFARLTLPGYLETVEIVIAADKKPHLRILRQLLATDASNRIIAILVAECNLEESLRPLIWSVRSNIISHEWGGDLGVTIGGEVAQFHLDARGVTFTNTPVSAVNKFSPIRLALSGIEGPYYGLDHLGQPVLAFYRQVKFDRGISLGLVLKVDQHIAAKPVRDDLRLQLALWCAMFIVGLALCILMAKQLSRPIRELTGAVERIASGDLAARAPETDRTEIGQLALVFNGMVAQLQTWQQDLEQQVSERTKELQQKNAELERFTYTVSHDLKSPIITIKGFTGSLEKDLAKGNYERMAGDLKRVSDAADKMNDLLRDLLELSTIGRIVKTPEAVDMNLLVADVLSQLAGPLKNSNMAVDVQSGLPEVFCDRRRMAEVLQNLLENAIKYMGDQADPQIQFGMREEAGEHIFFVQDNGIGIDEKYHKIIFGLFNKLDAASEGTGVGLALVKRIVEVHGGRVWVESEGEGMGSCFCFTIKEVPQ